jgi:hypothetical protein
MELDDSQAIFELVEEEVQKSGTQKYLKFLLFLSLIIIVLILIGTLFIGIISPRLKIKEFNELYSQGIQPNKSDLIYNDSSFYSLKIEEAFLKSKLAKSDLDSISLSINIPDSLLTLEIKGIAIYNIKIDRIKMSSIFYAFENNSVIHCFSSPFNVSYQYATVVKEPIVIKKAPKDTIEANLPAPNIDTLKPKMVAYYFLLDKDIILDIRQSEKTEMIPYFEYLFHYNYWTIAKQLKEVFNHRPPNYSPRIQIEINCKDALALYRALPNKAIISIHL